MTSRRETGINALAGRFSGAGKIELFFSLVGIHCGVYFSLPKGSNRVIYTKGYKATFRSPGKTWLHAPACHLRQRLSDGDVTRIGQGLSEAKDIIVNAERCSHLIIKMRQYRVRCQDGATVIHRYQAASSRSRFGADVYGKASTPTGERKGAEMVGMADPPAAGLEPKRLFPCPRQSGILIIRNLEVYT